MKTTLFLTKVSILFILLVSICQYAMAFEQQHQVTGTVKNCNGEPIPGVNVVIKGTNTGTITDLDGNYTIYATPSNILAFSFIGMQSQQVRVKNKTSINVTLQENTRSLAMITLEKQPADPYRENGIITPRKDIFYEKARRSC